MSIEIDLDDSHEFHEKLKRQQSENEKGRMSFDETWDDAYKPKSEEKIDLKEFEKHGITKQDIAERFIDIEKTGEAVNVEIAENLEWTEPEEDRVKFLLEYLKIIREYLTGQLVQGFQNEKILEQTAIVKDEVLNLISRIENETDSQNED